MLGREGMDLDRPWSWASSPTMVQKRRSLSPGRPSAGFRMMIRGAEQVV